MHLPLWYLCGGSFKAMRDIGKAHSVCKVFPAPRNDHFFFAPGFLFFRTPYSQRRKGKNEESRDRNGKRE